MKSGLPSGSAITPHWLQPRFVIVRHHLPVDVDQLAGCFVVEIGLRQAWPFLGLCDNRPSPAQELRLYIDATWSIEADSLSTGSDDDSTWLTAALGLNGETIDHALVDSSGTLRMTMASGLSLVISGEPESYTVGDAWWLSGWRSA